MINIVILPIVIPLVIGLILIIFPKNIVIQRALSMLAIGALIITSFALMTLIQAEGIQTLQAGGWDAPFGISLVADMFSTLLVFTSSVVSLFCLLFAFRSIGREREQHYFYPLFLFLLTGVNGSFLTGDIFNLFVCFEVMLISSYVLIALGGTKRQLRESLKYILVNVVSSVLFLLAIAYLYGMMGTLNLAHLSLLIAEVGQTGLLTLVSLLFLIVFATKAALFLFFWLPGAYSAPPTAVAAIFAALLTKVGIYSILRIFTLIFYHELQTTHFIIAILAAATMILGGIGAVAYSNVRNILTYNVIVGVGFIMAGLASFTAEGISGSIYYLVHDIIVKALIFLLGGTIIHITGTSHLREISGLIRNHPFFGWLFFIAALSLAGIPPLSGFVGKVFITKGTFQADYYWLGLIGLFTSLMVLYSLMKIFMNAFWGETLLTIDMEKGSPKGRILPLACLTALTVLLGLGAEGISGYIQTATETLLNPYLYIDAVIGAN